MVISTDGGRLRVRRNKRGQKTKKGRSRYHTDWREPKLLVIYVVDEKGRLAQEFAPVIDGTLQGPDEVFRLMEFYLRQLEIHQAKEVLFIADGAKWIWQRVTQLWQRLGLVGVPLPGTGRFLPRGRARLCPGGLEHVVAGVATENNGPRGSGAVCGAAN